MHFWRLLLCVGKQKIPGCCDCEDFFAASRQHNPAGLGKSIRARVYRGGKALLVPVSDAGDAGGGGGGGNKQSWKLLKMLAFAVVRIGGGSRVESQYWMMMWFSAEEWFFFARLHFRPL